MNSLKDHVRKAHPTIHHFLTYADNYAVGYFKKQGFTKEINFDRERWVGYIKDYEGGTIMQCTMVPKIRYLEVHQMLADQKAVSPDWCYSFLMREPRPYSRRSGRSRKAMSFTPA